MSKTLGYMITWTTYGTWLQGDLRGYVKNGKTLPADKLLSNAGARKLFQKPVRLSKTQQKIVRNAILTEAKKLNQNIFALAATSNHIHIVAEYIPKPISSIVSYYKNAARLALRTKANLVRVWTKGYDKRYCFDKASLRKRIDYVRAHSK